MSNLPHDLLLMPSLAPVPPPLGQLRLLPTADTVLSTMNRDPGRASIPSTVTTIVEERGVRGLFLGLPSRIVWSGAIISGQFLLYDVCKTALHVSADDLRIFLDVIASAGL